MYLNASSFFVPPPAIPDVQYKVNACIILISLACNICCGLQGGVNVYPPGFGSSFSKLRGLPPILSIMKPSEAPGINSKQSRTPTNSTSSKLRKALNGKYFFVISLHGEYRYLFDYVETPSANKFARCFHKFWMINSFV